MKRWIFALFAIFLFIVQPANADTLTSGVCAAGTTSSAGCAVITTSGFGTVGIQITGSFSGTLSFEATNDDTNWVVISAYKSTAPTTAVTSTTTTGLYSIPVAGVKRVRVRFSAFTSGSAVVTNIRADARLSGGGGGNPFDPGGAIPAGAPGSLLVTSDTFAVPTWSAALAAHPEITPTWAATTDFSYGDSGDVIVCFHGGTNAFCGEWFTGDLSGMTVPNWASKPNVGDTLTDGDVTLMNVGTWANFLALTPTQRQRSHSYATISVVYPPTPLETGNLYLQYPTTIPCTSQVSNPSGPGFEVTFSNFAGDNDCFWMNVGPGLSSTRTTAWGPAQCATAAESSSVSSCGSAVVGAVTIDTGDTAAVVNTTQVRADSLIHVQEDVSLGTRLGVTCKTNTNHIFWVSARTPGVSFTISNAAASATNPTCLTFFILNPNP